MTIRSMEQISLKLNNMWKYFKMVIRSIHEEKYIKKTA